MPVAPRPTSLTSRAADVVRARWFPLVLVALAGVLSVAVQRWVYPFHSWNRDELTYLWHVDVLRSGALAATDGGFPSLFRPFLTATGDGTIFSQYPVGWPVPMLLGSLIGAPGLALWASTAMVLVGTRALALELGESRLVAGLSALVVLGAPILALHSGMYLNYLFTLALGLFFACAVIGGVRRSSVGHLLAAGALLGWIFLTRPYDALIWAVVVGIHVVLTDLVGRDRAHLVARLRLAAWGIAALIPFVAVQLWINLRLTGSLSEFAMTAKDPLDTFGFGPRRIMPAFPTIDYTPALALSSLARNVFWTPFFLAGAHLAAAVAIWGIWAQRRLERTWFLVALGAAFPLAYLVFWGNHISSMIARLNGPIYFIPAYVPLSILVAHQLVHVWRRRPRRATVLAVAMVAISLVVSGNRLLLNRDLSLAQEPWSTAADQLDGAHLVVVSTAEYLLYLNPVGGNSPGLDDEILYVTDVGAEIIDLMATEPDRVVVQQESSLSEADLIPSETPHTPDISFRPVEIVEGGSVILRARVIAGSDPVVVVTLTAAGVAETRTLSTTAAPGDELDVEWTIAAPGTGANGDLTVDDSLTELEVVVGYGDTATEASGAPVFRHRYWARLDGDVLQVVAPGRAFRLADDATEDEPNWLEVVDLSELVAVVEATGR